MVRVEFAIDGAYLDAESWIWLCVLSIMLVGLRQLYSITLASSKGPVPEVLVRRADRTESTSA